MCSLAAYFVIDAKTLRSPWRCRHELDATYDADGFSVEVDEYLSAFIVTRAGSDQY